MEIEVKLRLKSQTDHKNLLALLIASPAASYRCTNLQENFFFDDSKKSLATTRSVYRLRRVHVTMPDGVQSLRHYMTFKSKGTIIDGISRINEEESIVDQFDFEQVLDTPDHARSLTSKIPMLVQVMAHVGSLSQVGTFRNKRTVFDWSGLCLEIDETLYPFGTAYEVEVEHVEPEMAKDKVVGLFRAHGIEFEESHRSKFGTMLAGSL